MDNNTIQFQPRTNTLSDREILHQLSKLIDEDSLTYEEYILLKKFQFFDKRLDELYIEERKLNTIIKAKREIGAPNSDVAEIQSKYDEIQALINKVTEGLSDFEKENAQDIRSLTKIGLPIIEAHEREKERILVEEWHKRKYGTVPKPTPVIKSETVLATAKEHDEEIKKREEAIRQEEHQRRSNHIKSILSSVPLSVVGLLEFYLVHGITALGIALIFVIVSYIPVLNIISDWLMRKADNTPDMFAICFGLTIAYIVLAETVKRIIKNKETQKFTLMFTGICLTALNVIFLIVNLVHHDAFLVNILIAIAGVAFFYKGKNL